MGGPTTSVAGRPGGQCPVSYWERKIHRIAVEEVNLSLSSSYREIRAWGRGGAGCHRERGCQDTACPSLPHCPHVSSTPGRGEAWGRQGACG